jgi:hypothetical protein
MVIAVSFNRLRVARSWWPANGFRSSDVESTPTNSSRVIYHIPVYGAGACRKYIVTSAARPVTDFLRVESSASYDRSRETYEPVLSDARPRDHAKVEMS